MSAFGGLILTNKGRNLQAKAETGIELKFTRMGIGDGELGSQSILELNSLKNEVKSLDIKKLKSHSQGQATIGSVISSQDITAGFYFREIGLFATDPNEGEILYCYGNSGVNAEYIPVSGGPDIVEKSIDIIAIVGNASNVSAVINQSLIYETPEGAQEKANTAESNAKTYADNGLSKKVDKVSGKVLSSNDFTNDLKSKLEGLQNYDSCSVDAHLGSTSNPHGVTVSQIGAETPSGAQTKANTAESNAKQYTDEHKELTNNPHGATPEAMPLKIMSRDASGKTKLSGILLSNGEDGFVELKIVNGEFGYEEVES